MQLKIEPTAMEAMIEDAVQAYPDECCGFVYGLENGKERQVVQSQAVHNAKEGDKRRRFEIAPGDYMQAEQWADEYGLQLLGVYHSHPDHLPVPSETDRLAAQPYFSYLILSVSEKQFAGLRSWQLNDEQKFVEEAVVNGK